LSTSHAMGEYYLFVTFFTFTVFLIALELAIPFSKEYLHRHSSASKRRVFTSLVLSQGALATLLSIPAAAFYFATRPTGDVSPMLFALFAAAIVSETCVNEVGRFFWNIGETDTASRRDLVRTVFFVVAVVGSVAIEGQVVAVTSLATMTMANVLILCVETQRWGHVPRLSGLGRRSVRTLQARIRRSMSESLPQVLHMQIIAVQPLLERVLVERSMGLSAVGSYSFQYSMIQAGAGLILLPVIATTRRAILSAATPEDLAAARRIALSLLAKILAVAAPFAVLASFAVPLIATALKKDISSSAPMLIAALLSSAMSTFASGISPMFASRDRAVPANLMSVGALLPLLACIASLPFLRSSDVMAITMAAIVATSLCQAAIRVGYLLKSH
jgi:O-antigen/teichoic acid export membrane protein